MRRSNRGFAGMDVALSLSFDITTGVTYGILLGCDANQQTFIRQQLQNLREMARHPLLLPVLLAGQQQLLLFDETERLWLDLLRVENASGQTGVIVAPIEENSSKNRQRFRTVSKDPHGKRTITTKQITNKVLGVVQLASTWESHIKALIQDTKAMQQSLKRVDGAVIDKSNLEGPARALEESLEFTLHKSNTVLWDLEYINKRAGAQMTAVSLIVFERLCKDFQC